MIQCPCLLSTHVSVLVSCNLRVLCIRGVISDVIELAQRVDAEMNRTHSYLEHIYLLSNNAIIMLIICEDVRIKHLYMWIVCLGGINAPTLRMYLGPRQTKQINNSSLFINNTNNTIIVRFLGATIS